MPRKASAGPDAGPAEAAKRKKLLLGAAAGGVLALLLVWFVVLPALSGGDDLGTGMGVSATAPKRSKSATSPTATAPTPAPSARIINASLRDPFAPLPEEAQAADATAATAASVQPSTPAGATSSTTTTTSTTTPTNGSSTAPSDGQGVMLLFVQSGTAKVQVTGTTYNVSKNGTFGDQKQYTCINVGVTSAQFKRGTKVITLKLGESQTF